MRTIAVLFCLIAAPALAAEWPQELEAKYRRSQAPLRVTRLSPDILQLEGEIDHGDSRALADQITPDTRTLMVNSAGGEVDVALEIAELIATARLRVVVDGAEGHTEIRLCLTIRPAGPVRRSRRASDVVHPDGSVGAVGAAA